ncbi:arginine--tRNA ligase [Candidatus Woesearchaeota archaeon]|nr:arginine--tRNA ligase [Candidatus Woesearchaeota archaeon]
MVSVPMNIREELVNALTQHTSLPNETIDALLSTPPDTKLGDFTFPCFKLAKNPNQAAQELHAKISESTLPDYLAKIQVMGGYLNFFVNTSFLAQQVITTILQNPQQYGKAHEKKSILIEYCGPNTNKPLHLGHIRNMALGNAMCRMLTFQGNTIHPVNIINDRGVHICKSMLAYQKWGHNQPPTKKSDHYVGDFYVLFAQKLKEDPTLEEQAQHMLVAWENNDPAVRTIWKKMNQWVLEGFAQTYQRFGISFEKEYFESEIYEKGKEMAFAGLHQGLFIKDDKKAIVAPLAKYNLTDKIVLRGDGTSIYITQDMYLAKQRYEDYKFDEMMYVVASEQRLHFQQLFAILDLLGHSFAKSLFHLSYGLVNLPTGRMKSREGTVVDADDFMDEMSNLAYAEVEKRYATLSAQEKRVRAEAIGLAAIKFFMLKTDPVRDIIFNPEESLSFDGETGPYLQYTYARASSIMRKAPTPTVHFDSNQFLELSEQSLIRLLSQFPLRIHEATSGKKPHILCRYLLDLSQKFNEFYHACRVLTDDIECSNARLALVHATHHVLGQGLSLLGITALEEM